MRDIHEKLHMEMCVNLGLIDALRPGDIAYDIGANVATQAIIMSRLVGPRGTVVAVEAHPESALVARQNLVACGCSNAFVVNRAVAETTGETLNLYIGNGVSDSLLPHPWLSNRSIPVQSVALDDLHRHLGLTPAVIKMDIEGAEFMALNSGKSLIREHMPTLILEQNAKDDRCIRLLDEWGYDTVCLNSYRRIRGTADYPRAETDPVRNVLCYPRGEAHRHQPASRYADIQLVQMIDVDSQRVRDDGNGWVTDPPLHLPGGRYTVAFSYDCPDDMEVETGIWDPSTNSFIAYYGGNAGWLRFACFDMPFHLDKDQPIQIRIRAKDRESKTAGITINRLTLTRVEGLPAYRPGYTILL